MHELSIAQSVMDTAAAALLQHPGAKPLTVGLRIGDLAGIDGESLEFCFTSIIKGTSLEGVALHLERTPKDDLDFVYLEMEEP